METKKITVLKVDDWVKPKKTCPDIEYGIVRAVWIGTAETDGKFFADKELASIQWLAFPKREARWLVDNLMVVNPPVDENSVYRIKNDANQTNWELHCWLDDGRPLMNLCGFKSHIRCFSADQLIWHSNKPT